MPANVIKFPNGMGELPATAQEARQKIITTKTEFANDVCEEVFKRMMMDLEAFGFGIQDGIAFQKDYNFIAQAIQAHVFRHSGLAHNMQILIDKTMKEESASYRAFPKRGIKIKYKLKKDPAK